MKKNILISVVSMAIGAALVLAVQTDWSDSGNPDWRRVAPYSAVQWNEQSAKPNVLVDGSWYRLDGVNEYTYAEIENHARSQYGQRSKDRIAEDPFEVFRGIGIDRPCEVTLVLTDPKTGDQVRKRSTMTKEKRKASFRYHNRRELQKS